MLIFVLSNFKNISIMKKDIEELKSVFDVVLLKQAEFMAELNTLSSMVLGVYEKTLPKETYRNLYTNFVNMLEENINSAFSGIEQKNILFDNGSFFLKHKFEVFEDIQNLKRNGSYIQTSNGDNSPQ
jgi:hypothetical protein